MSRNTTLVKQDRVAQLNEWRTELENGIYAADYENPYYDNSTFASHFYDPDNGKTYIPFAKQAKETGAKYFKLAGESYKNKRYETSILLFRIITSLFRRCKPTDACGKLYKSFISTRIPF